MYISSRQYSVCIVEICNVQRDGTVSSAGNPDFRQSEKVYVSISDQKEVCHPNVGITIYAEPKHYFLIQLLSSHVDLTPLAHPG